MRKQAPDAAAARVPSATLGYKVRLYPTRNKAETLAVLAGLFKRIYDAHMQALVETGRATFGQGRFTSWTQRRALQDFLKSRKAGHQPGKLKAEIAAVAEVGAAKKGSSYNLWITISAPREMGKGQTLFLPAKSHIALNRTLAFAGARLNGSTEVFRRRGKWYALVSVTVPLAETKPTSDWIGCDIGARSAVTRSDGYQGPDLRPVLTRARNRRAMLQKHGVEETRDMSPQRQVLAREARKAVSVARRTGRGVALEDPKRLIRWKQHAARFFGKRVLVLAAVQGVAVQVISPPYTSSTCSACGHVEPRQRHREAFRCWHCGFTHNADINASRVIGKRAPAVLAGSQKSSLAPPTEPRGNGEDILTLQGEAAGVGK